MLAIAAIALAAVVTVLYVICRGSDSKAQHEAQRQHDLCISDHEAEAQAESILREAWPIKPMSEMTCPIERAQREREIIEHMRSYE